MNTHTHTHTHTQTQLLEHIKTATELQKSAIRRLKVVIDGPKTNPFWMLRELRSAMTDAEISGLTTDCFEVGEGLKWLAWAEERAGKK